MQVAACREKTYPCEKKKNPFSSKRRGPDTWSECSTDVEDVNVNGHTWISRKTKRRNVYNFPSECSESIENITQGSI